MKEERPRLGLNEEKGRKMNRANLEPSADKRESQEREGKRKGCMNKAVEGKTEGKRNNRRLGNQTQREPAWEKKKEEGAASVSKEKEGKGILEPNRSDLLARTPKAPKEEGHRITDQGQCFKA